MYRRLYFLLPDAEHAGEVARELEARGLARECIHVIAGKGATGAGLTVPLERPTADPAERFERWVWSGNLVLFFVALAALLIMAASQIPAYWLLLPLAVMGLTFTGGMEFVKRVPDVHRCEFRDALRHRELLLTVDVPAARVAEIEAVVHRRHPEVVDGGVGWTSRLLHI